MQKYKKTPEDKNEEFSWRDITFQRLIMPRYTFYDYDDDGEEELLTYSAVQGGLPALFIGDVYCSVYKFTSGGITLEDSFFGSYNRDFIKIF